MGPPLVPQVLPGRTSGRCLPCGEAAPLVPYLSDIPSGVRLDVGEDMKLYNYVETGSYPKKEVGFGRVDTPGPLKRPTLRTPWQPAAIARSLRYRALLPGLAGVCAHPPSDVAAADGFAGYNLTQVTDRCTPPYSTFRWAAIREEDRTIVVTDGTDVPYGITPDSDRDVSWTPQSVERWCQYCVTFAGDADLAQDSVSISNFKHITDVNVGAMAPLDWCALFLCAYIVGLTLAAEVKDIELVNLSTSEEMVFSGRSNFPACSDFD